MSNPIDKLTEGIESARCMAPLCNKPAKRFRVGIDSDGKRIREFWCYEHCPQDLADLLDADCEPGVE